jgi:hypothetical protein
MMVKCEEVTFVRDVTTVTSLRHRQGLKDGTDYLREWVIGWLFECNRPVEWLELISKSLAN